MGSAIHEAVLQACRNFMIPIARFLLRNGVTFKEFAEVSKWAFVQVAAEDYGAGERKASVSRISVATGLSRKEATRCLGSTCNQLLDQLDWSAAARVLQAWHTRGAYLDSERMARPLAESEFRSLVLTATPQSSAVAVRDELVRSGNAVVGEDGSLLPTSRFFVPDPRDLRTIEYVGLALHNLASTLNRNALPGSEEKARFFERSSFSRSLPNVLVEQFMRKFSGSANELLKSADDWLGAFEDEPTPGSGITGVGIYFFSQPHEPPAPL